MIPLNAVGVLSNTNDDPTRNVGTTYDTLTYDIVSKSSTQLSLRVRVESAWGQPLYLGAITSPDGSEIYWVNNTKPLP